jgi:hypothetical protein
MVQKLTAATPGTRVGVRLALRSPRRSPPASGATLRDANALGLQAFEANPDVQRAKRSFGQVASPVPTDRRTPTGQYITPSVRGLAHQRAVARGQVAEVARAKALSQVRQANGQPNPTPTDLMVADHMATAAVRASDEQYATTIANTLTEVRRAVDDVEGAYPPQPESLLASLPPNRIEQLRLYADLAWRGSPAQFADRVDEVVRANDRPAYIVLAAVGASLISEADGRFRADPDHQVIERALAGLDAAFTTPRTAETKAAVAWVTQARQALDLVEQQLAQPNADELLPISFQVGSFAIFEAPPPDADATWYADRHELLVAGAVEPWRSPFVLQPSGRLEPGGEEEAEATAPARTLRDEGSRGT